MLSQRAESGLFLTSSESNHGRKFVEKRPIFIIASGFLTFVAVTETMVSRILLVAVMVFQSLFDKNEIYSNVKLSQTTCFYSVLSELSTGFKSIFFFFTDKLKPTWYSEFNCEMCAIVQNY